MNYDLIFKFMHESNKIEGILRKPYEEEIQEFIRFLNLENVTIEDLNKFVSVHEPNAVLRDKYDMNVRVGSYYPPFGGPDIPIELQKILDSNLSAYHKHLLYEKLHPFTDCNGRSGRALWAQQTKDLSFGFLHMFYYQTLADKSN